MPTLLERLPLPEKRPQILDDCSRLLDAEVDKKGGMMGLAIKAGYKLLRSVKPGMVREAIDSLIDDFIAALEPHYQAHLAAPAGTFGAYLKQRPGEIAESLVGVTDERAKRSKHKTLAQGYMKLRSSAVRSVSEAVPGLADLFDRYTKA